MGQTEWLSALAGVCWTLGRKDEARAQWRDALAADPENALLSRMPLQRMDAETLYDALLTTAGRLDPTAFGKPAPIEIRPDKEVVMKPAKEGFRRAIYVLHRRQTPLSLMDAFDQPAMTPGSGDSRALSVALYGLELQVQPGG